MLVTTDVECQFITSSGLIVGYGGEEVFFFCSFKTTIVLNLSGFQITHNLVLDIEHPLSKSGALIREIVRASWRVFLLLF